MMNLDYVIRSFPDDPSRYRSVTETCGNLSVVVDGAIFVSVEEMLLLEFASFAKRWLDQLETDEQSPFYFKSMDEEEEPIIAFQPINGDLYRPVSCWSTRRVRDLRFEEVTDGIAQFVSSLRHDLKQRYGFDLDEAVCLSR